MGDYIFMCWEDKFQGGVVMTKFALDSLKAKRVALFHGCRLAIQRRTTWLANYFKDGFTAGGGEIVDEQKFTKDDKDFKKRN